MAWRTLRSIMIAAIFVSFSGFAFAEDEANELDPALRTALADAATILQKGLAASEQHGRPISAKFEMADGKVQLSVYNATADGFVETVLDPNTGAIIEAEPITDAEDLAAAKTQKAAIEKATVSLPAATDAAIKKNAGSRAVSVVSELQNGQPVAKVKLLGAIDIVTVAEPLN